jgi:hypothetical protein
MANWPGEIGTVNTALTSAHLYSAQGSASAVQTTTTPAALTAWPSELDMPSPGATKYYQMQGWYVAGQVYEVWVDVGTPSNNPPSGHTLIDVAVAATWVQ